MRNSLRYVASRTRVIIGAAVLYRSCFRAREQYNLHVGHAETRRRLVLITFLDDTGNIGREKAFRFKKLFFEKTTQYGFQIKFF